MALSREFLLAERGKQQKMLKAQILICREICKETGNSWAAKENWNLPQQFYHFFSYTVHKPEDMAKALDRIKIAPLIEASGLDKATFIRMFNEVGHEAIETIERENDRIWKEVSGRRQLNLDNSPNNPWAQRWDFDD